MKHEMPLKNEQDRDLAIEQIRKAPLDGSRIVELSAISMTRTAKQNRALHKYLTLLANELTSAGYSVQQVLSQAIDRDWDMPTAKSQLWKPLQKIIIGKESTADAKTNEYTKVYETLNRFMAEKFGISVAWPEQDHK